MPGSPLLYYITDRTAFAADEPARRRRLLEKITEATRAGIDYIQLREKDLSTRELESLAREAVSVIAQAKTENRGHKPALLINSRTDVALVVGADGVHLRSDDVSLERVRTIWEHVATRDAPGLADVARPGKHAIGSAPLIAISCHTPDEVHLATQQQATFAVFAPVFEKKGASSAHPAGLTQLQEACKASIPVLALGGVTLANARSCLEAGAQGIAAIRLFQENDIAKILKALR